MSVNRGKALTEATRRAWTAGAGPEGPVTIDVDSTICEVSGKTKAGAAHGYTNQLGYHPLLAVRADTGEIVAARLRGGASQQGNAHYCCRGRPPRPPRRRGGGDHGADRRRVLVAWPDRTAGRPGGALVDNHSPPLQCQKAIEDIPETAWESIDYTETGAAQAAETLISGPAEPLRLVVRRTRITGHQATIWTDRGTTPSPPTPICPPSKPTGSTAVTHPSSSLSAISKKADSLTCPPGVSTPTPAGSPARCSPTT